MMLRCCLVDLQLNQPLVFAGAAASPKVAASKPAASKFTTAMKPGSGTAGGLAVEQLTAAGSGPAPLELVAEVGWGT
jgi:hypothetical protein